MRPEEIVDAQGSLIERLGDQFGRFMVGILGARVESFGTGSASVPPDVLNIHQPTEADIRAVSAFGAARSMSSVEEARERMEGHAGAANVTVLTQAVKTAYCYRVTHDMEMLLEHAASALDDSDTVELDLPPTGCGFVRFDRPVPVTDVRGLAALVSWLVWGRVQTPDGKTAIGLWSFNDPWTHPDEVWRLLVEGQPDPGDVDRLGHLLWRFLPVSFDFMVPGSTMGSPTVAPSAAQAAEAVADGFAVLPGTNIRRYAHALWLLLNQTVVTQVDEPLDRPARRRAGRRGIPPKVVTIKLRRSTSTNRREGESNVEWSHRWIVRGHWRWQAYGPGRKERRRIWIAPFVKGPEDAPLFVTDKVYDLSR